MHNATSYLCAGRVDSTVVACCDRSHAERVASANKGEARLSPRGWEAVIYDRLSLVWESAPEDESASWRKLKAFCDAEGWRPFRIVGPCRDPLGLVRRTMAEHADSLPVNISE